MAKQRPSAASSTDDDLDRASIPFALGLESVAPAVLPGLAALIGATAPTLEACRALLRDRAAIKQRLLTLPAYAAVTLEVLAEVGGEADVRHLVLEIARRTGFPERELDQLVSTVGAAPGFVLILDRSIGGQRTRSIALIAESAARVAELVRGVSAPRGAPPSVGGNAPREVRDRIALATLLVHRPLRLTMDGHVHGSSLKSFVKGLGVEPRAAEPLLERAQREGVIVRASTGDMASLSGPALASVAASGSNLALDQDLRVLLPSDPWVTLEAASRALAARDLPATSVIGSQGLYFARGYRPKAAATEILGSAAVEVAEHDGVTWVRARSPERDAAAMGDGHVTPSFDVLLGPGAAPSLVASVGLGAALTRMDHVLTFHLGPRTVEAGLKAGMDPADFVRALERVGRHGLPDNVRAMIDDWIKSTNFAIAEEVILLRIPVRAEAAIVKGLGAFCVGATRPGHLVVGPRSAAAAIQDRLRTLGVDATLPLPAEREPLWKQPPRPPWKPLLPPWPAPDAEIVARYEAEKARGFKGDLALLNARAPASKPTPPAPKPAHAPSPAPVAQTARQPGSSAATPKLREAARLAASLFESCRGEIGAWVAGLDEEDRADLERGLDFPILWAPLLGLLPEYQQRALRRSRSIDMLLGEAFRLYGGSRRSQRGIELMNALAVARIREEDIYDGWEALFASDETDSLDGIAVFSRAPSAAPVIAPATSSTSSTKSAPEAKQPEAVRKWMLRAHQQGRAVRVKVAGKEATVQVTGVRTQGKETVLLVVDLETDEGRALRLDSITSVAFVDAPQTAGASDPTEAG